MDILKNTTIFLDGTIVGGETTVGAAEETTSGTTAATDETADTGEVSVASSLISTLLLPIIFIVAMWLILIRPQRKQEKKAQEMRDSLKLGDSIVTSGGLYGKVITLGTDSIMVEFGENRGVRVWVRKDDILGIKEPVTTPPPAGGVIEDKKSNKEDKKSNKKEDKKEN